MDIVRGSALIKHYFPGKDLAGMSDEEWSRLVAEALYIAKLNAKLFAQEVEGLLLRAGILKKK